MIGQWLSWWAVSTVLAAAAFPLAFRIFHRLPDRGYGISRALGLLAAGYTLWLGASTRLLRNDLGGALAACGLLVGVGLWTAAGRRHALAEWLREKRGTWIAMEIVFGIGFALWSFVRANNPDIVATEKPMELAFLNSILRSEVFPPADPWLSGYAISYYYFGYVLLAFLARVTGVAAGVAFNLGNALWFALAAIGLYSLLHNLLAARDGRTRHFAALLAPLFVLIIGNLEGLLEVAYSRHLFWTTQPDGTQASPVFEWLGLPDLAVPPGGESSWIPQRHWMWWQASRVVNDYTLTGVQVEVIDEFPLFSFLLADNHPHVLALPFVVLGISFALQIYLSGRRGELRLNEVRPSRRMWTLIGVAAALVLVVALGSQAWRLSQLGLRGGELVTGLIRPGVLTAAVIGLVGCLVLLALGVLPSAFSLGELAFAAWLFGGLVFLNTWDFPIYLSLVLGVLWWVSRESPFPVVAGRLAASAVGLAAAGILLYLPWYPHFSSQAGGVLPNLAFPTRLTHFLLMFGGLLTPLVTWLLSRRRGWWDRAAVRTVLSIGIGLPVGLLLLSWIMGALGFAIRPDEMAASIDTFGAASVDQAIGAVVSRRLAGSWTALALGGTLGVTVLLLKRLHARGMRLEEPADPNTAFTLLLIGIGALLVLGPEFLYLRDLFGTRMNTVFKFYFAAWILWGLACSYVVADWIPREWSGAQGLRALALILLPLAPIVAVLALGPVPEGTEGVAAALPAGTRWFLGTLIVGGAAGLYAIALLRPRRWSWGAAGRALAVAPLVIGMIFTVTALWAKTEGFRPSAGRTLDGTAHLARYAPEDAAAIQWIREHLERGVIAEAVGGSYTEFARISAHTGLPTVLGWPWHEVQWRGDSALLGSREADVRRLYESRDWMEAESILQQYGIEYVFVGQRERAAYPGLYELKFQASMEIPYQSQSVTIYSVRDRESRP